MNRTQIALLTASLSIPPAFAHAEGPQATLAPEVAKVAMFGQSDVFEDDGRGAAIDVLGAALRDRVSIAHKRNGEGIPAAHCRRASEGCDRRMQAFAGYLVDVGRDSGIDPWLLSAMAVTESGLDPFVVGGAGELGILQIHPKRPDAKDTRFMRDAAYRRECRKTEGACQREIVEHAARILNASLRTCHGSLRAALGAYNSGRCNGSPSYATRVLAQRSALRHSVPAPAAVAAYAKANVTRKNPPATKTSSRRTPVAVASRS